MVPRSRLWLVLLGLLPTTACFVENIAGRYCTHDTDCTEAGYSKCDTRVKTCVPASFDFDMGTSDDMTMLGCQTSATCPPSAPTCSPAQVCSSCGTPGMSNDCNVYHSGTPYCGPNGGCVECLNNDNCDAIHESCSVTNVCVDCVNNADCASGLCSAGKCADKTSLLYVNNATGAGCSDTGAGSFAMPFCHVQTGLNASAMSGKTVVVFAGTYVENVQASPTLNGGNDYVATAVGIGAPIIKPGSTGAALAVNGTAGKQVTASFDGFVFDGSTLADGSDAVDCNGGSGNAYGKTLATVTRSTLTGASGVGLFSQSKCALTFDADIILGNKGGGISLSASDFALTNLLVHDNGTSGAAGSDFGGLLLSTSGESGKMSLFNLTVVDNLAKTTAAASGINCVATPSALTNTLVLGNSPLTEISAAGCGASYSSYVGATGSNNQDIPVAGCTVGDLLVNPSGGNFHPKKSGTAPCTLIDLGTNTGAPGHDLDGTARPQPSTGTDDIGCYEAL